MQRGQSERVFHAHIVAAAALVVGAGGAGGAQDGFVKQIAHACAQVQAVFVVVADVEAENAA